MCLEVPEQNAFAWQTEASNKSSTQPAAAGAEEAAVDQNVAGAEAAVDQTAVVAEGAAVDQNAAVAEGAVDQIELEASYSAWELRIRVEEQQA
jgi:hypothetical protein